MTTTESMKIRFEMYGKIQCFVYVDDTMLGRISKRKGKWGYSPNNSAYESPLFNDLKSCQDWCSKNR